MAEEELVHIACVVCGKSLINRGSQKYCGYTCSGIGRTKPKPLSPECSREGCTNRVGKSKHNNPNKKWRKFCSRECFYQSGYHRKLTCSRGHDKQGERGCPTCRRANRYVRMYGMTFKEAIEFEPPKACEICDKEVELVVDHNHETGEFRGSLCGHCNSGLGHFMDNPQLIKKAFYYLKDRGYYG